MSLNNVLAGANVPDSEYNVIIEISANSNPVKYKQ